MIEKRDGLNQVYYKDPQATPEAIVTAQMRVDPLYEDDMGTHRWTTWSDKTAVQDRKLKRVGWNSVGGSVILDGRGPDSEVDTLKSNKSLTKNNDS